MLPYSRGLILDNTNNYGIVKTETLLRFGPKNGDYVNDAFNSTEPLEWIFTHGNFGQGSLPDSFPSASETRSVKDQKLITATVSTPPQQKTKKNEKIDKKSGKKNKKNGKKDKKKKRRHGKGVKKCIFKVIKSKQEKKNKRGSNKVYNKMQKKYILPLILGLLAAKSLLIPIALKALAFLSAKGLMMGFFSTVMASVLSLKGMFDHSHYGYQNRKDDSKTQVEIIQVPSKSEDHVYYDEHYKRGDYVPSYLRDMGYEEGKWQAV